MYVEFLCRVSVNDVYDFNVLLYGFYTENQFFKIGFWFTEIAILVWKLGQDSYAGNQIVCCVERSNIRAELKY